jgi:PAS domain S-box-containing protein
VKPGILKSVASLLQVDGEIQEREERFRALVQNSFDIITIHDNEGVTVYESPAASRILGYPPGSLVGKAPFQAVHPGDVDRAREAFQTLSTGSNPVFIELRYRRADGSWSRRVMDLVRDSRQQPA